MYICLVYQCSDYESTTILSNSYPNDKFKNQDPQFV